MNGFDHLLTTVADYLTPLLATQALVTTEYPDHPRRNPLATPVVAVGLEEVRTDSVTSYLGEEEGGSAFGRQLELTLRFDLYAAARADCHRLFTALCQSLLLEDCPLPFGELWCDSIVQQPGAGGLTLTAKAKTQALLSRDEPSGIITQFIVRSVNP